MIHRICSKCGEDKTIFLKGLDYCYDCTSEKEIAERVKPDLTRWLDPVLRKDKSKILMMCWKHQRQLIIEQKRKEYEDAQANKKSRQRPEKSWRRSEKGRARRKSAVEEGCENG